jgi:uncharacterized membrane protein
MAWSCGANSSLLFWLSLVPAATAWLGENFLAPVPTAVYGITLLIPSIAWRWLQGAIIKMQGSDSVLASAIGSDLKGKASPLLYLAGVGLAFVAPLLSISLYILVAVMWLIPDRRIEKALHGG